MSGAEIKAWPKPTGTPDPCPKERMYPAEHGLVTIVQRLEAEMGTVQAYNRLVAAARVLEAKIDAGQAKPQREYAIGWSKPLPRLPRLGRVT